MLSRRRRRKERADFSEEHQALNEARAIKEGQQHQLEADRELLAVTEHQLARDERTVTEPLRRVLERNDLRPVFKQLFGG